jgi:hypothetical protein
MATAGHNIEGMHPQKVSLVYRKLTCPTELGDARSLDSLPLSLLYAELRRRQDNDYKPSCGTRDHQGFYSLSLHVFALFLILVLSTLGQCAAGDKCFWWLT